ncbi:MAG: type II toxin-antitoxin system death-on-curing family toxin [Acidobacteriota bacterium]
MTKRYLTKEQIIRIHEELIDRHGGLRGIMDEQLVESVLGRLQSGYYADLIEEAAALMESLGSNHPFFDGNKRVAVTSSFTFLMLNGYDVSLDEDEAFAFITGLFETGQFSFANIEPWIRKNVATLDQATENNDPQPDS